MDSDYIKTFYDIIKCPGIAAVLMVKNEEKNIEKSLKSVLNKVDAIIIYDTGSTDNTINIVKNFSEINKINLYLRSGEFIDFSTSRNNCLDFADTVNVDYLLLLDANDELKGDTLRQICSENYEKDINAFLVCQKWFSGKLTTYFNIRLIKARKNWRYIGVVHEYIKDISQKNNNILRLQDSFFIYQNRNDDCNKSFSRFSRDKELLLEDIEKDPDNPRSFFYLAQTCDCLGHREDALKYSKIRLSLKGFNEEIFHSLMRCGKYSAELGMDWNISLEYYLKAFNDFNRLEPLIRIAEYYKDKKMWNLSYMFIKKGCELSFPTHHILFVDQCMYDYTRWHLMGIIAYYVQEYQQGKEACLKAIEKCVYKDLDTRNLKFYLDKEKEQKEIEKSLTKKEFLNITIERLKKENPKTSIDDITKKATLLWKKR